MFFVAMTFSAGSAFSNFAAPLIIGITIDNVLGNYPLQETNMLIMWLINIFGGVEGLRDNIWLTGLAHLMITAMIGLFIFGRHRTISHFGETTAKRIKDRLYDHIQKLPYNYHVHAKAGDLIQRCTADVEQVRRFLQVQTVEIARAIFFTTFALMMMIPISPTLTWVTMGFLPVIFVFSYVFFKYCRKVFKLADEKDGEMQAVLQESVTGIRVVRAFGRARFEVDKFVQKNEEFRELDFKQMKYLSWYWGLSDALCLAQIVTTFVVGVFLTYNGILTVGELVIFNLFTTMVIWPIRQLGRVLSDLGRMQVAVERIYEVLDEPAETDTEGAMPHNLQGDIVFENVDFEYEEGRKVFSNLSFTVKKGETIAILGATGSGKSTLMHILLRLYDYKSGSITVNGKELRDISKEHLRHNVGMVLQEPFLYSKTIMSNLKMARDQAKDPEIYEAAKTASAHGFITEFEEGYQTLVGERGTTLSGGQKQRVAIARTLIKNSEMLIFDDSLSAVDTETDAQIRQALAENKSDATTFIISQRITTLMDADRIFVIENGGLSDAGTHEELLGRGGLYKRIWEIQAMLEQDFEEEAGDVK